MKKKYKKTLIFFFVSVLTIALVYFGLAKDVDYAYSMTVDNFEKTFKQVENEQGIINEKIPTFYADENQTYIINSLNEKEINQLIEDVEEHEENLNELEKKLYELSNKDQIKYTEKLEANAMNKKLEKYYISVEDLKTKQELTYLINNLFSQEYMHGAAVNEDVFIQEDLNIKEIQMLTKKIKRTTDEKILSNGVKYLERLQQGIIIAEQQLADVNLALELRDELFKENDLLFSKNIEIINRFLTVTDKIKNPKIKTYFDKYLRLINKYQDDIGENNLKNVEEEAVDFKDLNEQGESESETSTSINKPNNNLDTQSGQSNSNPNNQRPNNPGSTGSGSRPNPRPNPKPDPEPKPVPDPEPKPEQKPEPEPKPEQKPEPEPKPEQKPEPKPEQKPEPNPQPDDTLEPSVPNESDD